ncbi:MAG: hypothetical protein JWN55_1449 [Frankiales bacterium]|nr:hypothetical protein [Frankiales bacterium]
MTELGTARRVGDRTEMRFVRQLPHPPAAVWAAITDPEWVRRWLGELQVELRLGGSYALRWLNGDASTTGSITALEPERLLEVATDVHGTLRWELTPEDHDATRLVFTATTPLDSPEPERNLAGWHWHLDTLAMALEGHQEDWAQWDLPRWERLYARYTA